MKHKPSAKSWRASFLDAAALSIKNCLHAIKQAVAEAGHIMMVVDVFHAQLLILQEWIGFRYAVL